MPAIDFKALFEEERARRRRARADGATTTTASGDTGAGAVSSAPPGVVFAPRERLRLADHDVGACRGIAGLHYVPDFITPDEETAVLAGVYASGTERRWTPSGMRRVQNWGGSPGSLEVTEPLPPFADALRAAIVQSGVYSPADAPNHVLVNEYRRPAGIAPHNDGAVYAPRVAIITLRGSALMDFWPDDGSPALDDDRSERARARRPCPGRAGVTPPAKSTRVRGGRLQIAPRHSRSERRSRRTDVRQRNRRRRRDRGCRRARRDASFGGVRA